MAVKYFNNVRYLTAATGTGATIVLGSVPAGWQSFGSAGAVDGDEPPYEFREGSAWEIGYLTLGNGTTEGTRTVVASSNGGARIALQGTAILTCVLLAGDILDIIADLSAHIANTGNPHAVTKSQVGLGSVTNDAQLTRGQNDWTGFTEKTTPTADDLFLIEDSAASGVKKKVKRSNVAPFLFRSLTADASGVNANTAQPWFPSAGAVTVDADTTYFFEGFIHISRAAGTTSHTTSLAFGGTASIASLRGVAMVNSGNTAANENANRTIFETASTTVVKAASTTSTEQMSINVKGTVRIAAAGGGTLIPQFQYSAAPGGVPTIKANSFFSLVPIGSASADSAGTWS